MLCVSGTHERDGREEALYVAYLLAVTRHRVSEHQNPCRLIFSQPSKNKGSKTTIGKEACHEWITDTLRSVSENVGGAKNDGKYLFATRSPPCWLMKTAVVM